MICSSVNLLFFMSVILLVDGLPENYAGTAGGGQVKGIKGFMSSQRATTDALNALSQWKGGDPGRSHRSVSDEDAEDMLIVELTTSSDDDSAGLDLDAACIKHGLKRTRV
jgi:hypothetical protein